MRRIIGMYIQRIREKVPDPQRKQCRRCSRLQFHFLCVPQWQLDLSVRCRRKEIQDDDLRHSRRCHWCCRQYIHLPQRQLDLYLGQKRQETQHPFRPIIGECLRGYRINNFEKRNPSPEKLLMNERPVPANGSSMKMALTLLLKATNNKK